MECNSCDRKAPNHNNENRSIENRGGCFENKNCGNGRNANCNMNRNSNNSMSRNMNCSMNRSTNNNMNWNMNRNSNYNMNKNMNNSMNRSTNWNMNRSSNNNMDRNMNNNMKKDMNDKSCCEMKCIKNEGCDRGNEPVDEMKPGMGFVPWQEWRDVYDIEKALGRGTIFEELDKPYLGRPVE